MGRTWLLFTKYERRFSPLPAIRRSFREQGILCRVSLMTLMVNQRIEGTMSPQAHARVDEKYFVIVGTTFSNTVGEFGKLLSSSERLLDFLFTNVL